MTAGTLGVKHTARALPMQFEGHAHRRDHGVRHEQLSGHMLVDEKSRGVI
ncbi:hypothetical protein [Burkholderia sp. Tr-20390]|nr:hypothetical protein [Burkholderia sp. Tr-20390]